MWAKLKTIFPVGLEPRGKEEEAQWVLRSMKDIDRHSGRCRIVIEIAPCTLTSLALMVNNEISELQADHPGNVAEEWFIKKTLEDFRKLRTLIDEADEEAHRRYSSNGRPGAYTMRLGQPAVMSFERDWMELVMKEELESVKLPRAKQA